MSNSCLPIVLHTMYFYPPIPNGKRLSNIMVKREFSARQYDGLEEAKKILSTEYKDTPKPLLKKILNALSVEPINCSSHFHMEEYPPPAEEVVRVEGKEQPLCTDCKNLLNLSDSERIVRLERLVAELINRLNNAGLHI